ncbi:MAG: bifunctional diaminohydroxyphosphoribosylaminopyrimidine deaminase/5-amino-6-(5-phosphoribosylamino)uracil reductase RibD [Rubrivivax sp.]
MTELDRQRLSEALALAEQAIGLSDPNPRVGCVIGREDGTLLGRGHTRRAGQAHAEVDALADARRASADVKGATAWVTLEPCAHQGRTPPCCDALVDAGIARAVVAMLDPFPAVNGAGIARLRAAGVQVDLADGDLAEQARELNIGFFTRIEKGRPWVRLKAAMSLDGRTALENGRSQWITSAAARADGHAWRRRAGAVLTGIGTILADDPRLDVRDVPTTLQPLRVVLDSRWRTPRSARVLQPPGQALICGVVAHRAAAGGFAVDVELLDLPTGRQGLSLPAVLAELSRRQINEVHVEAGARLNGALLEQGLVDEIVAYVGPMLLGPGWPMALLEARTELDAALRFRLLEVTTIGSDARLRLQRLQ